MRSKSVGHYLLGKTIGEGTFGRVKLGKHILTDETVAVKILEKARITDVTDVERVARELHILKLVQHPHVVQLYEIIETHKQLYLIMEYCCHGELFDYIVAMGRVPEPEACRFFHQILAAVERLHALGVVHRDLKPENLLLDEHRDIKIVDFGLSNTFRKGQMLGTACGSPCYAAPEMIAGHRYAPEPCDVWSCGVILFALVCGYLPFEDANTSVLYSQILSAKYEIPDFVSPAFADLVGRILTTDPTRRATASQIREHPWYQQIPEAARAPSEESDELGPTKIALDEEVLQHLARLSLPRDYAEKCLRMRKHNHITTTYYLLSEQKRRLSELAHPRQTQAISADAGAGEAPLVADGQQVQEVWAAFDAAEGLDLANDGAADADRAGGFPSPERLLQAQQQQQQQDAALQETESLSPPQQQQQPRQQPAKPAPQRGQNQGAQQRILPAQSSKKPPVGKVGGPGLPPMPAGASVYLGSGQASPPLGCRSPSPPRAAARGGSVVAATPRTVAARGVPASPSSHTRRRSPGGDFDSVTASPAPAAPVAVPLSARADRAAETLDEVAVERRVSGQPPGRVASPQTARGPRTAVAVASARAGTSATATLAGGAIVANVGGSTHRRRSPAPANALVADVAHSHGGSTHRGTAGGRATSPSRGESVGPSCAGLSASVRSTSSAAAAAASVVRSTPGRPLSSSGGNAGSSVSARVRVASPCVQASSAAVAAPSTPGSPTAAIAGVPATARGPGPRGGHAGAGGTFRVPSPTHLPPQSARARMSNGEDAAGAGGGRPLSHCLRSSASATPEQVMQEVLRALRATRIAFKQVSPSLVRCEKRGLRFDMHVAHEDHSEIAPVTLNIQRVVGETSVYHEISAKLLAELKI